MLRLRSNPGTAATLLTGAIMFIALVSVRATGRSIFENHTAWTLAHLALTSTILLLARWRFGLSRTSTDTASSREIAVGKFIGLNLAWLTGDLLVWPVYLVVLWTKIFVGIALTGYPMMAMPAVWTQLPLAHTVLIILTYHLVSEGQARVDASAEPDHRRRRSYIVGEAAAGLLAGLAYALLVSLLGSHYLLTS